jgi:large subunit ribosomal protein L10
LKGGEYVHKTDKEKVVAELTERLRSSDSVIVADYRGLTNTQLLGVRSRLRDHGATFTVVKNTLGRRAAEAAGAEALLALLEGPTAIAFVRAEGDPVAVAKALADTAKETKILQMRGGVLSGRTMTAEDVEELAKLPSIDVVKSQVVGVILAPLSQLVGLLNAPLQDLFGLIEARIEQLERGGDTSGQAAAIPAVAETAEAEVAQEAEVAEEVPAAADESAAEPGDDGAEVEASAVAERPEEAAEPAETETETNE